MPAQDWFLSFAGGLATALAASGVARIAFEAAGRPSPATGPWRGLWAAQEFAIALGAIAVVRTIARRRKNPRRFLRIYALASILICALVSFVGAKPDPRQTPGASSAQGLSAQSGASTTSTSARPEPSAAVRIKAPRPETSASVRVEAAPTKPAPEDRPGRH